jgi:Lrp/AsnC family transcriptional regulator
MDRVDRKILALLQQDATLSLAELSDRVGLSQTPCWKRIQKLEQTGVIVGRVALLDAKKIGLGVTVFVSIETADHSADWIARFAAAVSAMPEVMDCWRMAGDVDYLLRVVTTDLAAYDEFYKRLVSAFPMRNVSSRIAIERVKGTTAFPIPGDGAM